MCINCKEEKLADARRNLTYRDFGWQDIKVFYEGENQLGKVIYDHLNTLSANELQENNYPVYELLREIEAAGLEQPDTLQLQVIVDKYLEHRKEKTALKILKDFGLSSVSEKIEKTINSDKLSVFIAKFEGHSFDGEAVVLAETKESAFSMLEEELIKKGLPGNLTIDGVMQVAMNKESIVLFDNGDY